MWLGLEVRLPLHQRKQMRIQRFATSRTLDRRPAHGVGLGLLRAVLPTNRHGSLKTTRKSSVVLEGGEGGGEGLEGGDPDRVCVNLVH